MTNVNAKSTEEKAKVEAPKAAEKPVDPKLEKQIEAAKEKVEKAKERYDKARAYFTETRQELRKLTGEKKKVEKGPGVIQTILDLVKSAPKTGISKDAILERLVEQFPDRDSDGMNKTIGVQLPGRMNKERNVEIVKLESGNYAMK